MSSHLKDIPFVYKATHLHSQSVYIHHEQHDAIAHWVFNCNTDAHHVTTSNTQQSHHGNYASQTTSNDQKTNLANTSQKTFLENFDFLYFITINNMYPKFFVHSHHQQDTHQGHLCTFKFPIMPNVQTSGV
jgi:hypothetical protein